MLRHQIVTLAISSPDIYLYTDFTPYLLKLGLAKSQTSLVWIAPPLSGLIVQPVIGTISDSAKFRWGRRRPLMLAAALLVGVFMLTLGWAAEIVGILFSGKTVCSTQVYLE